MINFFLFLVLWPLRVVVGGMFLLSLAAFLCRGRHRDSADDKKKRGTRRVVFLHPDLGIGGAERLIVDAAVGLASPPYKNHVVIYTNFHDPKRAFPETVNGTLCVRTVATWIPRSLAGRGLVLFATLRMIAAAFYIAFTETSTDVFIVDQVAAAMPVLRLLTPCPVFFYCHFPDQLCDPTRMGKNAGTPRSALRVVYRAVFDRIEAWTMHSASKIVCNSKFTLDTTLCTFPSLSSRLKRSDDGADVLYPAINVDALLQPLSDKERQQDNIKTLTQKMKSNRCIVSINRFERKKNLPLAVKAFAKLLAKEKETAASAASKPLHLIVAGGYDPRLEENVQHHKELVQLASDLGIADDRISFMRSFTDAEKKVLLQEAEVVTYTPTGEHFGIVPIEAMAYGKVVVAVNSGGPTESVTTGGQYGFLCDATPEAFCDAFERVTLSSDAEALKKAVGAAALDRCLGLFSLKAFSKQLNGHLAELCQ